MGLAKQWEQLQAEFVALQPNRPIRGEAWRTDHFGLGACWEIWTTGEPRSWRITNTSEGDETQFRRVAARAGRLLGCPNPAESVEYWLDHVRTKNPGMCGVMRPQSETTVSEVEIGEIQRVCEGSAHCCYELATEHLGQATSEPNVNPVSPITAILNRAQQGVADYGERIEALHRRLGVRSRADWTTSIVLARYDLKLSKEEFWNLTPQEYELFLERRLFELEASTGVSIAVAPVQTESRMTREPHSNPQSLLTGKTQVHKKTAMEIFGLGDRRIRGMIEEGKLRTVGSGQRKMITVESIQELLK